MDLHGRRIITTDCEHITKDNILQVLSEALSVHQKNREEIDYLLDYFKGKQPIQRRHKDTRPEINNKVVENHAMEIVDFKVGHLLGKPVQYINRVEGSDAGEGIGKLNAYTISEGKEKSDRDILEWNHICGLAYRMVLPDSEADSEQEEAPFELFTTDPRNTFVDRLNVLGKPVCMGVYYVTKANGDTVYTCYTKDKCFIVTRPANGKDEPSIVELENPLGIPIVEYPANNARMGEFEGVLDLLDALNNVQSNRMDGVEQFIQALMLFHNVDIDDEKYDELREKGAIKVKDPDPTTKGDVKYLVQELNQQQTQTLKDDLYEQVLVICGMPNRNGGSSTSDTGSAVEMRDGWSAAETRAKASETIFKRSEIECLKLILKICKDLSNLNLKISDIEIHFTRRNYENISEKATVLTTMLGCEKIAPQLAFEHCGMFADPEMAWKLSQKYAEEQEKKRNVEAQKLAAADTGGNPGNRENPAGGETRGDRDASGRPSGRVGRDK